MISRITANNFNIETVSQLHHYAVTPSHRYLDAQLHRHLVTTLLSYTVAPLHQYSITSLLRYIVT